MTRVVKVFVIMPSGNRGEYNKGSTESDHIFETIITPGVTNAALKLSPDVIVEVHRIVDRNESGSITSGIVSGLIESDIVIADVTGQNANVFFELGMRCALRRKVTILLAQAGTMLPFDIKVYRYLPYDPFVTAKARDLLTEYVIAGLSTNAKSDSLVFDQYPSLTVRIPGILEAVGDVAAVDREMPWDEYFGKIQWLGESLKDALNDGSFAPDVVVGISNGGLVFADLLGRNHLRGTPVISLWANRFRRDTAHACWYFKNQYNDILLAAVAAEVKRQRGNDPPSILLVDDRVGTGQTALQAIDYMREVLGPEARIVFLPLIVSRPEYIETIKSYLPCNSVDRNGRKQFRMQEAEFMRRVATDSRLFPYKKSIVTEVNTDATP